MNQNFKTKYDEMKSNNPASSATDAENYFRESNIRTVCFVLSDGDMISLNYGYLVKCEYMQSNGSIVLTFTSDVITLEGVDLQKLYFEFMQHLPRQIKCTDERYNEINDEEKPIVNKIDIKKNSE